MLYPKTYSVMYIFLILLSLFAPEPYGVTLKYVIAPLALMVFFGLFQKDFSVGKLKFRFYFILCLCWIVLLIISTLHSNTVDWTPNARSLCLLILFFAILYQMVPEKKHMDVIKHVYIWLTLFCALWIIFQVIVGIDRINFQFVFGKRDINYLSAFMIPGIFMSIRFLVFEKKKQKPLYILCILTSFLGILLTLSRAASITLALIAVLTFIEYMLKTKFSASKVALFIGAIIVAVVAVSLIWNSSYFARLTALEGYEENVRLEIWEYAFQAFFDSPIIGSGLGASNYFSEIAMEYQTHCNYIDILGDTGIVGMTLFVLLSIQILKVRKGHRWHMLTYYVACMLPLGFINGLQTIAFWLPMILLAHEHTLIERGELE